MRHPHFNEPGYGGWEGTETETSRSGRVLSSGEDGGSHVPPDARRTDEVLSVQTLDVACAFALETRRESPFADAILAHLSTRSAAIATTVETRIAEAHSDYPATAQRFEVVLRRTLTTFQERLAAASAEPAVLPPTPAAPPTRRLRRPRRPLPPTTPAARCTQPPPAPVAPGNQPADAEEIARLEARLEELRRRNNAPMEESSTTTRAWTARDMRGPEASGPGRRLDSTETAPDPAPALAAAAEAEARRAAPRRAAPQGRRRQARGVPRTPVAVRPPRVIMFELETQHTSVLDSSCGEEVDGEGEHEVDQHLGQPAERSLAVGEEGEDRARAGRGGV